MKLKDDVMVKIYKWLLVLWIILQVTFDLFYVITLIEKSKKLT